jgi:transposase InsO family protein
MDFVHDQLARGRKLRILTIIDTFSRFSPATGSRFSYRAEYVVKTLEHVCHDMGYLSLLFCPSQQGVSKVREQCLSRSQTAQECGANTLPIVGRL